MVNTDYWHSFQVVLKIIPISRNLATIQLVSCLLDQVLPFKQKEEKRKKKIEEDG